MVYLFAMLMGVERAGTATGRPPSESAKAAVEMASIAAGLRSRACGVGGQPARQDKMSQPVFGLAAEQHRRT